MDVARETTSGKLQLLVPGRSNEGCNMARFYVLAIEPVLFGDSALIREGARLGANGPCRLDRHADLATAAESLDVWLTRKVARGYRLR